MGWYRLHATHGPEHQDNAERYMFIDEEDLDDIEYSLNDVYKMWAKNLDAPNGSIEFIEGLPQEVHDRLVHRQKNKIYAAEKELRNLARTPVVELKS